MTLLNSLLSRAHQAYAAVSVGDLCLQKDGYGEQNSRQDLST